MKTFIDMLKDDAGASAAEYALILAIVGSGIAAGAIYLGDQIAASLKSTGNEITACTTGTPTDTTC